MIAIAEITRPANTTHYAIGDVINGNGVTIPIVMTHDTFNAKPFVLQTHIIGSSASGTPSIDLYFFSSTFTIASDNAAFNPSYVDLRTCLGKVSHTSWTAFGSCKVSHAAPVAPIQLNPAAENSGNIYIVAVAAAADTPNSAEKFTIKIDVD